MVGVSLPEALEREFGALRHGILREVGNLVGDVLQRQDLADQIRLDAPEDEELHPDLVALLKALGISAVGIVSEEKLRRRLRALADNLSAQKRAELTSLLGVLVEPPSPRTLDRWIDAQVIAITREVNRLLAFANEEVSQGLREGRSVERIQREIEEQSARAGRNATLAASAAVLALNAEIVSDISQRAGSTHYRWITEGDAKVRENHQALHDSIQSWDEPPPGGGTRAGDEGHPGSGWGCRCIAVPLAGQTQPQVTTSAELFRGNRPPENIF